MHLKHKTIAVTGIKTSGLAAGEFIGYASTFGNVDHQGDRVMPGAFAKSVAAMASGSVVPIAWEHDVLNPANLVGEIKSARETAEGLEIHAKLDVDTERGAAAYRAVKGRRVGALSIGYSIRSAVKAADGVQELTDLDLREVSLVARPANDKATISAVKASADDADTPAATSAIVAARAALAKAAEGDDPADAEAEDAEVEMTVGERLLASLEAATAAAEEIVKAAEDQGRDLTEPEAAEVAKGLQNIAIIKRELRTYVDASPAGRLGIQYGHDVVGKGMGMEEFRDRWGYDDAPAAKLRTFDASGVGITTKTKTQEATTVDTNAPKFLTLGSGRKAAAAAMTAAMVGGGSGTYADRHFGTGTKALTTSGQVVTDVPLDANVIPTGRPAVSLLDVLPTTPRSTPTWRYLRQSARDLQAAPVAPGATKPTSDVSVATIDGKASVIAHLSSEVDKFVLADNAALTRFVADELVYGLDAALQAQILTGDGVGANLTGILATSGVQVTPFASNILTTVRKSLTNAEALGYSLGVIVMRPEDWESVELAAVATDAAVAFNGAPVDLAERKLWGCRVVLSAALPAKTAVMLDPSAVSVDVVGRQVDVEWDGSGDLFARNALRLRVEGRFGLSVYQPAAIYRVSTAAA